MLCAAFKPDGDLFVRHPFLVVCPFCAAPVVLGRANHLQNVLRHFGAKKCLGGKASTVRLDSVIGFFAENMVKAKITARDAKIPVCPVKATIVPPVADRQCVELAKTRPSMQHYLSV